MQLYRPDELGPAERALKGQDKDGLLIIACQAAL